MQYSQLGRSGLKVSRLCLGTMNFGPQTEEPAAHAIMDAALEAGINFFDTADVYGGSKHRGCTEEILGRWFAQGGGRRERTVLATKVYGTMADRPNESRLSALHIRHALDASLRRLQTEYIDLYQFHHVDRNTPWEEIWQAVDVAVQQGKILYSGSSNFAGWHLARAQEAAAHRPSNGLVSEQSIYNLLTRNVELEVIPAAQHYGLGSCHGRRCTAGCSAERSRRSTTASAGPRAALRRPSRSTGTRSAAMRTSRTSSATSPENWRWPGCCTSPP